VHFDSKFRSPVLNKALISPQKEQQHFRNGVKILQITFDGASGNVTLSIVNSFGIDFKLLFMLIGLNSLSLLSESSISFADVLNGID